MSSKQLVIATWVLRILLAALFIMTGMHKLTGDTMMVAMFDKIGFGQGFRLVTGTIEIACALFLLWPRTSRFAPLGMGCVLFGALVVQLLVLHGDVVHVIVIAAMVLLLSWLQRTALTRVAEEKGR